MTGPSKILLLLVLALSACASADIASTPSEAGVSAYRAKDYGAAWAALEPLAQKGHYRAQRYVAFMLMQGNAPFDCAALEGGPDDCALRASRLMIDAARRGDNNALIVLEGMRAGGAPHAPSDAQMVALETERALNGDPLTAWRLAKRYRVGDGVAVSAADSVRWLRVAAKGRSDLYPKATDAAYLLCEAYARGDGVREDIKRARKWCQKAIDGGHNGAVIALTQLQRSRGGAVDLH